MLQAPGANLSYVPLSAEDTIPMEVTNAMKPVATSSIINSRKRARVIPTAGQSFGVGAAPANGSTSMNFVVSSPSDWLDPASATLHFTMQFYYTAAQGTDYMVLDDLATSLFQRCRIYGGGTILDDTLYRNILTAAEVYASTPIETYKGQMGATMYAWKYNDMLYGGSKNAPAARAAAVGNPAGATGAGLKATFDISIPLSALSSLFRAQQLIPLRSLGSLNIVLDMDPNIIQNGCYSTSGATNQAIVVTGVEIRSDLVTLSPLVQSVWDAACASPEGCPIMGYESATGLVSSYQGSTSASQKALVIPKVTPSLSHVLFVKRAAAVANLPNVNGFNLPLTTFEVDSLNAANSAGLAASAFVAVGSNRVPQDPASVSELFLHTADVFGARQGLAPVMDGVNFCGLPSSVDDLVGSNCQILGFNFEKTRDASIFGALDQGGQQITLYLQQAENANVAYNVYAFVIEHKYLRIRNNTVMVETMI